MIRWYERWPARIGLRLAGLALLACAWAEGSVLHDLVDAGTRSDPTAAQLLVAALLFVSASLGAALAVVGAGLWKPVALSDRWVPRNR